MRIFPPPLEIGDTEGFTAEKDLFERAAFGRGMARLVGSVSDPMVIALDGPWGTGKTTFLRMWAGELRQAGYPVIWFDAFEHDYFADPFLALAGEVVTLAQDRKLARRGAGKKIVDTSVRVSRVLLRSGLKVGAKAATFNLVDGQHMEEIVKALANEASELTDKYLGELLTTQRKQKDTLQAFRGALGELPGLLAPEGTEVRPLIFIIDELDRCRPEFALQTLERIKHLFAAPNVHFVLGVNLDQLRSSVSLAYGAGVDAQVYLEKFIQLRFRLPDEAHQPEDRAAGKFLRYLYTQLGLEAVDSDTAGAAVRLIHYVAIAKRLSLRTLERVMSTLALSLTFAPPGTLRVPLILGGLCILKVTSPELFDAARAGQLILMSAAQALALPDGELPTNDKSGDVNAAARWWAYCLDEPISQRWSENYDQALAKFNIHPTDVVPMTARQVVEAVFAAT